MNENSEIEFDYILDEKALSKGLRSQESVELLLWEKMLSRSLRVGCLAFIFILVGAIFALFSATFFPSWDAALPFSFFGGLFGIFGILMFARRLERRFIQTIIASRFLEGKQQYVFNAQGLIYKTRYGTWKTGWNGIESIVDRKTVIVMKIAGMLFVVPKNGVSKSIDANDVFKTLTRWHADALEGAE